MFWRFALEEFDGLNGSVKINESSRLTSIGSIAFSALEGIPKSKYMSRAKVTPSSAKLKLLPAYAGVDSIEAGLRIPRAAKLLWLEILVNDHLDLTPWKDNPVLQESYSKACRWYTSYRSVLTAIISRTPLPHDSGPIDFREYRTFAEALRFVADHP